MRYKFRRLRCRLWGCRQDARLHCSRCAAKLYDEPPVMIDRGLFPSKDQIAHGWRRLYGGLFPRCLECQRRLWPGSRAKFCGEACRVAFNDLPF